MMTKPALLTALLTAALVAGCASPEDAKTQEAAPPTDPVSQQLGAAVVAAPLLQDENATLSVDTPFLLPATTGPDGPLTAFKWRIPKGAIVEYQPIPNFDFTIEEINFEMVPVFTAGAQPTEFIISFVSLEDEAYLMGMYLGIAQRGTWTDALVMETSLEYQPTLESEYISLYAGGLEEGDEIGILVAGKSEQPGDFGLLFSPMTEEVDYDDDPAKTPEALLDGRSAATLAPSGSGTGFAYAMYNNMNLVFATSIYNIEVFAGDVQVDDRQRAPTEPIATLRDTGVSAAFDAPGYSMATAYMFQFDLLTPNCASAGTFDIALDLHGTTVDYNSLILEAPRASLASSLLLGSPLAMAIGEGAGAATSTFTFNYAAACGIDYVVFEQFDLGATFGDLFGVPAATGGAAFTGIAGNVPPAMAWAQGDDLVLFSQGRLATLQGLGYLADPQSLDA